MDINSINPSLAGQLDQANANREAQMLQSAANSGKSEEAGKKFEAMLGQMLAKEMRKGLDEGFFGKGPGADSFSAWLDEHVGRVMAEQGTFNIGKMVANYVTDVENGASISGSNDAGETPDPASDSEIEAGS